MAPCSWAADHPRIRGEHGQVAPSDRLDLGSSPHTRGALGRAASTRLHRGIIPAYAGSTVREATQGTSVPDHPRIRGEHHGRRGESHSQGGSSPHTRGAHDPVEVDVHASRIIPAYAGSTALARVSSRHMPDHPRIRGEHGGDGDPPRCPGGSSPHTRGAPSSSRSPTVSSGIIPAYAGSTLDVQDRLTAMGDHPRIRGEHRCLFHRRDGPVGSSPHTRGALGGFLGVGVDLRIIPAYAGSTLSSVVASSSPADHPRIRGEHVAGGHVVGGGVGSSPHTRGAPLRPVFESLCRRIIPAYAGSTGWVFRR